MRGVFVGGKPLNQLGLGPFWLKGVILKSHGLDLKWGIRPDGKFKPIRTLVWGRLDCDRGSTLRCCPGRCHLGLETSLVGQPLEFAHPRISRSPEHDWLAPSGQSSLTVYPPKENRGIGFPQLLTSSATFCAKPS